MELRYYQSDAESAAIDALKSGLNPVIQLPTGSGKSLVIASMAAKFAKKRWTPRSANARQRARRAERKHAEAIQP